MDRAEAIWYLSPIAESATLPRYKEALGMAIAALREQDTLKRFVMGEWVDCKAVQDALDIDFATGIKMFEFSRTAEWNPAPMNGQRVTTQFRLKLGGAE